MKYIKLFENFSINEKKEPMSEVDHDALFSYLRPKLLPGNKLEFDSEARKKLAESKGKKLDLAGFIQVEKPSESQLDKLPEVLKELGIGIFDESWANMIGHPKDIITLDRYFIKKGVISTDQLRKMPDFSANLKNAIESDKTTWSQGNYNQVESNMKYDGLGSIIGILSVVS